MEKCIRYTVMAGIFLSSGVYCKAEASDTIHIAESNQANILTRDMLATLPILKNINRNLMGLIQDLTYGKTPQQIISALAHFYVNTEKPLVKATIDLIRQKNYISAAIDAAQLILNALPSNTPRAGEVQQWIADLNEILTCIENILMFIKDNPQLVAMILK